MAKEKKSEGCKTCNNTGLKGANTLCPVCGGSPFEPREKPKEETK